MHLYRFKSRKTPITPPSQQRRAGQEFPCYRGTAGQRAVKLFVTDAPLTQSGRLMGAVAAFAEDGGFA